MSYKVINDILDFSKIESGRLDIEEVQFSLGVVLDDVGKMLSFAAERKNLEFLSDIQLGEHKDLVLLGDPGRVRQILTNLLTNSIKFTSQGYVKLSARVGPETTDTTTVSFTVEDSGIGIAADVRQRLFKPFSQADSSTARRFGGTGLGLTISKNLVDLMHGQISLDSKPENGTIATFSIPFTKPQFSATQTPLIDLGPLPDRLKSELSVSCNTSNKGDSVPTPSTSPPYQSPRQLANSSIHADRGSFASAMTKPVPISTSANSHHILVVEDNAINQQIAIRTLKNLKYSVSAVWNGQEALEYLLKAAKTSLAAEPDIAADQPRLPDCILMDVQMPVLDGYKATHALRHHAPYKTMEIIQKIPIVAMTASAIQGDRERCERAGMNDYLAKPVKRATLEKMLTKWVSGEQKVRAKSKHAITSTDQVRPDLSRSGMEGTDHSSNCPDVEYNTAEDRDAVGSVRQTAVGKAPALRAPVDQGTEGVSERTLRRAEAEEMATSLRDARLIAATEPEEHHESLERPSLANVLHHSTTGGSFVHEAYPDQHGSSQGLDLTEENVAKFNSEGVASPPKRGVEPESPMASLAEMSELSLELKQVSLLVPDVTVTAAEPATPAQTDSQTNRTKTKRGLISTTGRQKSDWSNASTVKPPESG